jgi:dTDP-glucose 4,6-dehydratase
MTLPNNIWEDCGTSYNMVANRIGNLKDKVILVTGGTGFAGSWLCSFIAYLNRSHQFNISLLILSRNATESDVYKWFSHEPGFRFMDADVRNLSELPSQINYIIHAAATPDVTYHSSQPIRTYETIVNGTFNICNAAYLLDYLQHMVHLSSGLVYGKNATGIYQEEDGFGKLDCSHTQSVYAESKRMSETIVAMARNQFRLPVTILRPFTFIGPFQSLHKTWAFNSVARDAIMNNCIRILGDGKITRGYMYGSDMAALILGILANPSQQWVYNLGSDKPTTLTQVAQLVAACLGSNPSIEYGNFKSNLVNNNDWLADNHKMAEAFEITETIPLQKAIERALNWYQQQS